MSKILAYAAVAALAAAPVLATHGILLVSDQVDGVKAPQYFDSFYENALREAYPKTKVTYAVWDHYTQGEPSFEVLRKYKVIIWFTSTSGEAPASDPVRGNITLSPSEQASLAAFLGRTPGTTTVMLSGMYVAWNCVADAVHEKQFYKPLFSDYLKLNYPRDNFYNWIKVEDDWKLVGSGSDPIIKDTYTINWRHHKNFPDQLEPAPGGAASAWWEDLEQKRHHRGVIRAEGKKSNGGKYKIVLFSCPFENILHEGKRAEVMRNFLDWAGGWPFEEVGVEPASLGRVKALFH
ncbi:MAG TPA: hypothetical protein VMW93_10755 [bacterium]|nr:hypothetical protein [bacterium]